MSGLFGGSKSAPYVPPPQTASPIVDKDPLQERRDANLRRSVLQKDEDEFNKQQEKKKTILGGAQ